MKHILKMILICAALASWPVWAQDAPILSTISQFLGTAPSECSRNNVDKPEMAGRTETPDGAIRRYRAHNCAGNLDIFVGVPRSAGKNAPVILALPQTGVAGAREIFGLSGDPKLAFGRKFMQAGFPVVSSEVWLNGNGSDANHDWSTDRFYKRFPQWSALGRMLVDNRSTLDLLPELGLKSSCTAAVGHSLGGHNALFLAAFDKRIDVVVSSGGFEPIATDTDAQRWSRSTWFVYMPALRSIVTQPAPRQVPFDFDGLMSTIYPRAVMVVQGREDPTWTNENLIPEHLQKIEDAYKRAKIAGQFDLSMFEGGHEFPILEQYDAIRFVRERCQYVGRQNTNPTAESNLMNIKYKNKPPAD